jgi:hypothetical protein
MAGLIAIAGLTEEQMVTTRADEARLKALLKEAIETAGDEFLGSAVMQKYGGWNLLCKFFDNLGPIPHHIHQNDEFAARVPSVLVNPIADAGSSDVHDHTPSLVRHPGQGGG